MTPRTMLVLAAGIAVVSAPSGEMDAAVPATTFTALEPSSLAIITHEVVEPFAGGAT